MPTRPWPLYHSGLGDVPYVMLSDPPARGQIPLVSGWILGNENTVTRGSQASTSASRGGVPQLQPGIAASPEPGWAREGVLTACGRAASVGGQGDDLSDFCVGLSLS